MNQCFIKLLVTLCLTFLFFLQQAFAQQSGSQNTSVKPDKNDIYKVSYAAEDTFKLAARYYAGESNKGGVIILHDCAINADVYQKLGLKIADYGIHSLVVDLRGYGDSTSIAFSHDRIKQSSEDIISYQASVAQLNAYWTKDLLESYRFLRKRVHKMEAISVVSSGCSSPYAVSLAENMHVKGLVMITPEMDYAAKERYKNLVDIPTYFISSIHHVDTYQTTKELFEWNGSTGTKMLTFKGDAQDANVLRKHRELVADISLWVKNNLAK